MCIHSTKYSSFIRLYSSVGYRLWKWFANIFQIRYVKHCFDACFIVKTTHPSWVDILIGKVPNIIKRNKCVREGPEQNNRKPHWLWLEHKARLKKAKLWGYSGVVSHRAWLHDNIEHGAEKSQTNFDKTFCVGGTDHRATTPTSDKSLEPKLFLTS